MNPHFPFPISAYLWYKEESQDQYSYNQQASAIHNSKAILVTREYEKPNNADGEECGGGIYDGRDVLVIIQGLDVHLSCAEGKDARSCLQQCLIHIDGCLPYLLMLSLCLKIHVAIQQVVLLQQLLILEERERGGGGGII